MIKDLALAGLTVSLITCGGWLLGQGAQLNKARKALDHQRAVSAVLAADLVVSQKTSKAIIANQKINKQLERSINGIDKEKKFCDFDAADWAANIDSLRQAATIESESSPVASPPKKPD